MSQSLLEKDTTAYLLSACIAVSTHLPETFQSGDVLSSSSSIPSANPALFDQVPLPTESLSVTHIVSALFVRKLSKVILPAKGPKAASKSVVTGHLTSPISLYV
jgi:hypothetical protein